MSSSVNEKLFDRTKIFETVLSSPGMQENCKIVLSPTRQTILVIARLIENGLTKKEPGPGDDLISFLPEACVKELQNLSRELLEKGGLVNFYEHLKQL